MSDGLAQNVLGGNMKVTVCGVESKLIDELSDESVAGFEVPAIATVFSEAAAGREGQAMLLKDFTEVASASSIEGTLFDGLNVPGLSNSGSNCSVGAKFASGFVGILDEMRFFMDYFPSKSVYDGNLKFQGSNDDFVADINDIVIVDANLHEGWNYFDLN